MISKCRTSYCFNLIFCALGLALSVSSALGEVVINEIHYDPVEKSDRTEFIELYNTGPTSVDLSGWRFSSGIDYTFPQGTTLAADAYLVVGEDPAQLNAVLGFSGAYGPYVGFMSGEGEQIRLRNASDEVIDEVNYGVGSPWPTDSGGEGASMELIHSSLDNNLGGSWRASSASTSGPVELLPAQSSSWRYRKGSSEASSPGSAWRNLSFSEDGTWQTGQTSVGYGDGDDYTVLSDMHNSYSSVYLRHPLQIDSAAQLADSYRLRVYVDDGCVVWINGHEVARVSVPSGTLDYNDTANNHEAEWNEVIVTASQGMLTVGSNLIAVHALNQNSGSSDFSIDLSLETIASSGSGSTPGQQNRQWNPNAPPQVRQIEHRPEQPTTSEPMVITAKVTDPEGVHSVLLDYQVVLPGQYIPAWLPLDQTTLMNNPTIELSPNPDYSSAANWTSLAMVDDGTGGDEIAGDDIFTGIIPAQAVNRTLVRYRVQVEDVNGASIRLPYMDDPSLNYACFVYNGVPAYTAQNSISFSGSHTYSTNDMTMLPVYQVITRYDDLMHAYAYNPTYADWQIGKGNLDARRKENWECALVYDGKVYDHVMYRLRQSNDRYAQNGKRSMRFNFRKGNYLRAKDHFGRSYPNRWRAMNVANGVRFSGSMNNVLPEGVNFELSRMFGLAAPYSQMFQLRVVDGAEEAPAGNDGQYYGDFHGYYLAVENYDERFKDAHDLADGNIYKLRDGWDDGAVLKKAQGRFSTTGVGDYNTIRDNLRPERSSTWLRNYTDWDSVYKYHAVVEGIRNYDTGFFGYDSINNKNQVWLFDLTNAVNAYGRCQLYIHDTDATWSTGYPGTWGDSPFKKAIVDGDKTEFLIELRNAYREFRDLIWQEDIILPLIDEHAAFASEVAKADRDRWYNAPDDAGHNELATLEERIDQMKGFAFDVDYSLNAANSGNAIPGGRAGALDYFSGEGGDATSIPDTPSLDYIGVSNYPVNGLTFSCSAFSDPQGNGTFDSMVWRIGEVTDPNAPGYDPSDPLLFEMPAVWQSAEFTGFTGTLQIPASVVREGHAYRLRVKMKDTSGRWSHWSAPQQFICGPSDYAVALAENLRITEVMYHPGGGEASRDLEFVEFQNVGTSALELNGVAITRGIDFDFADISLAPGAHVIVVRDLPAFAAAYPTNGIAIAGEYSGKLSDGGEQIRVRASRGGAVVAEFTYGDGRGWPLAADGAGHALVPLNVDAQHDGLLDYGGNWKAGAVIGGSPGQADPDLSSPVVINEVGAHTDYSGGEPWRDSNDWIELFNHSGSTVLFDSSWYLSDDAQDLTKWNLPPGSLGTSSWWLLTEVDNFHPSPTSGFGLDKAGEQVFLSHLPGGGQDRVVDAVRFKGQLNGATTGRYEDGVDSWQHLVPTPGSANVAGVNGVTIDEVMYHPVPDSAELEFIELVNRGASSVPLSASESLAWGGSWTDVWRIDGGVDYDFPPGTTLVAGERILVVAFDPNDAGLRSAFLSVYALQEGEVRLFGPYSGRLSNGGERVALERPQAPDEAGEGTSWIIVDELIYSDGPPWILQGDGDGLALQRRAGARWGRDPDSWVAGLVPSPGRVPFKVDLIYPSNGAGLVIPQTLQLEAAIDDRLVEGTSPQVEFFVDGTSLGSDAAAPFEVAYALPTAPDTYDFMAVMTDAAGSYSSAVSTVTVYTNQPGIAVSETRVLNTLLYTGLSLDGAVDLNGLPAEVVSSRWVQLSGSGSASFGNISLPATTVTFSEPGSYSLGLVTEYGGQVLTNRVSVQALATNGVNRIPYEEHFEDYDPDRSLVGILGWYGSGEEEAVVRSGSDFGTPNVPVLDQAHDRSMGVGQTMVNRFEDTENYSNIWFDALVDCRRWNEETLPSISQAEQIALLVNSSGHLLVWHDQGSSDGWTELSSQTFTNGQWARFTVKGDYAPGAVSFRLWVDGSPITSPMTVFNAAGTNSGAFGEIEVNGLTSLDDLVVEDYDILNYRKLTVSAGPNGTIDPSGEVLVPIGGGTALNLTASNYYAASQVDLDHQAVWTGLQNNLSLPIFGVVSRHDVNAWFNPLHAVNGVPQWWLAAAYPAWTNNFDAAAVNDFDHDGLLTWEEYIASTDPTNRNSVFSLQIEAVASSSSDVDLVWASALGRTYRAFSSTNLQSGAWQQEAEVQGDGGALSVRDTHADGDVRYYRMDVRMSD